MWQTPNPTPSGNGGSFGDAGTEYSTFLDDDYMYTTVESMEAFHALEVEKAVKESNCNHNHNSIGIILGFDNNAAEDSSGTPIVLPPPPPPPPPPAASIGSSSSQNARRPAPAVSSSNPPSRAHSRSPASPHTHNLAENQARRADAAWRCPVETPTNTKHTALSGNPHCSQHRFVGYKSLAGQSKRRLQSSISLDSLPTSLLSQQNKSYYSFPIAVSPSTGPYSARDQSATIAVPITRSSGIDKKTLQSRLLRRRPSGQLLSKPSSFSNIRLEDSMMARPQQLLSHSMEGLDEINCLPSHESMPPSLGSDSTYAPLPLSPPPSATRPDFTSRTASYISTDPGPGGYNGSEAVMPIRPHSMLSLQGAGSFTEIALEECVRRSSDPYQVLENPEALFMRLPATDWSQTSWMGPHMPSSIGMSMLHPPAHRESPAPVQWFENGAEALESDEPCSPLHPLIHSELTTEHLQDVSQSMFSNAVHANSEFRLAAPPAGRGTRLSHHGTSFRGHNGDHQEPPSPTLEDNEMTYTEYMERSCSTPSSITTPPDSPHLYYTASSSHISTPNLVYPQSPLYPPVGFPSNGYPPIPEGTESNGMNANRNLILPIPRSRTSSRSLSSSSSAAATAAAAAAAALVATKSTKKARGGGSRRVSTSSGTGKGSSKNNNSNGSSCNGSNGGGLTLTEMSFVNFTPQDATRILNGVAPSGSSKTKARREREALEKRKKLSEAAAAAVLAVGGDTSILPTDLC